MILRIVVMLVYSFCFASGIATAYCKWRYPELYRRATLDNIKWGGFYDHQ